MKKKTILCFLIVIFVVTSLSAQERGPAVVSPGSDVGIAIVGESCPTFSWTGMEWATAYRVAVFEAVSAGVLPYEEMEAMALPVMSKEIQGRALSWTPSSEERLSNRGVYVWYVQAADGYGREMWSEGKVFKVQVEARLVGMGETMRESLKEHGVNDDVIDDVLRDMESGVKEVTVWGADTEGSVNKTQDKMSIQGLEGTHNTFYGLEAGANNTGNNNSFFGRYAGYNNTYGGNNTFMGNGAGAANTSTNWNTIIGSYAGGSNTGNNNTFLGFDAGGSNTTGNNNTFLGSDAGDANTTGNNNTFVGYYAGGSNITGYANLFLGYYAGRSNTAGNSNSFIGYYAGYYNTGNYNSFMGYYAGGSNTTGENNTFLGYCAGGSNTTGSWNTYVGHEAGRDSTGALGTFIGYQAGYYNEGIRNTFIGLSTGYNNTSGARNTYLGYEAGYDNTTGSGNVFLGPQAGYHETGSDKLYIENSNSNFPLIYGEFDNDIVAIGGKLGVGTKSPGYPMHLITSGTNASFVADRTDGATNYINSTAGYGNFGTVNNYPLRLVVNGLWKMRLDSDNSLTMANGATCSAGGKWTDSSSQELKENIHNLTTEEAMKALNGLNPVKYNYKADKEEECVGFIAEDVPDLVASKDRKGMSPMDVVAVLTKVVQEQQETISELRKEIDELKKNR